MLLFAIWFLRVWKSPANVAPKRPTVRHGAMEALPSRLAAAEDAEARQASGWMGEGGRMESSKRRIANGITTYTIYQQILVFLSVVPCEEMWPIAKVRLEW